MPVSRFVHLTYKNICAIQPALHNSEYTHRPHPAYINIMSSPTSLHSPSPSPSSSLMRKKPAVPPGFIAPPRPKRLPSQMTVRELLDQHERNVRTLSSP